MIMNTITQGTAISIVRMYAAAAALHYDFAAVHAFLACIMVWLFVLLVRLRKELQRDRLLRWQERYLEEQRMREGDDRP